MERILEGNLAQFPVPDLMMLLQLGRRTGVFVLERPDQETKFFFREGRPVFATSSKHDLRLGSVLVRQGRIDQQTLDRLLASGKGRLGQQLLAEKLLSEGELAACLKNQISEVIFDTLDWTEGVFTFWDRVPPPLSAVTLEMDLQSLLMEGLRRRGEGPVSAPPEPDQIFETTSNPERVKTNATLTPEEWRIFFLVDGRRSVHDICQLATDVDPPKVKLILHNLRATQFITLAQRVTPIPTQEDPRTMEPSAKAPAEPVVQLSKTPTSNAEEDTHKIVRSGAVEYKAPPSSPLSRLIIRVGSREASFPLIREGYTLGRHRNNDILVEDPKVSSFHARLDRSAEGFTIVNLKSRNGTYVNGKRIEKHLLKHGDEVRLGAAKLLFKVDYTSEVP